MTAVDVALAGLALAFLLSMARVAVGPTLADRALAADLCLVAALSAIALLAVVTESTHFLDAVVVASLLHFISTMALARLLRKEEEG